MSQFDDPGEEYPGSGGEDPDAGAVGQSGASSVAQWVIDNETWPERDARTLALIKIANALDRIATVLEGENR